MIGVRAMAVSPDGQRLAFDGAYTPEASPNGANRYSALGLQYCDVKSRRVVVVYEHHDPPDRPRMISWSPDSDALAYSRENRIYVLKISTGSSRALADGNYPSWSPDGKWIAFRSPDGSAVAINPATLESRKLLSEKILGGVHWSPDSQYVFVSESIGFISNLFNGRNPFIGPSAELVVYRLRDGARVPVYWFSFKGGDDLGFDWVTNLDTFMKGATRWRSTQSCFP